MTQPNPDVVITRAHRDKVVTMGMLRIIDVDHDPIFTLENPKRLTGLDSCIPEGLYICRPYTSLRFSNVYEVLNVPGRTAILIHNGNYESNTTGCILLGLGAGIMRDQPAVNKSGQAMEVLRTLIGQMSFTLEIR